MGGFAQISVEENGAGRLSFRADRSLLADKVGLLEPNIKDPHQYRVYSYYPSIDKVAENFRKFSGDINTQNFVQSPKGHTWRDWLFTNETDTILREAKRSKANIIGMGASTFPFNVDKKNLLLETAEQLSQRRLQADVANQGQNPSIVRGSEVIAPQRTDDGGAVEALPHQKHDEGLLKESEKRGYSSKFSAGVPKQGNVISTQMRGNSKIFGFIPIGGPTGVPIKYERNPDGTTDITKVQSFTAYDDLEMYFEHPELTKINNEYIKNQNKPWGRYVTDAVKGFEILATLSIYDSQNKELEKYIRAIEKSGMTPKQVKEAGITATISAPTIGMNETQGSDTYISKRRREQVVKNIILHIKLANQGVATGVRVDIDRIDLPSYLKDPFLNNENIYFAEPTNREAHANAQHVEFPHIKKNEPLYKTLRAEGVKVQSLDGGQSFVAGGGIVGTARPIGSHAFEQAVRFDLGTVDSTLRSVYMGMVAKNTGNRNYFNIRADAAIDKNGVGNLNAFYKPTYRDLRSSEYISQGYLPVMPTVMPDSFFTHYQAGTTTSIYQDRFRALYGREATGLQAFTLRTLDAKLSDPGVGMRLDQLFGSEGLYQTGGGLSGFLLRGAGRILDTMTGYYAFDQIKTRQAGEYRLSLKDYLAKTETRPYDQQQRGFFENTFVTVGGGLGQTAVSLASYFGVTHAYSIARAQIEDIGVRQLLSHVAQGAGDAATKASSAVLLNDDYYKLFEDMRNFAVGFATGSEAKRMAAVEAAAAGLPIGVYTPTLQRGLEEYIPLVRDITLANTTGFSAPAASLVGREQGELGDSKLIIDELDESVKKIIRGEGSDSPFLNQVVRRYHEELQTLAADADEETVNAVYRKVLKEAGATYTKEGGRVIATFDLSRTFDSEAAVLEPLAPSFAGFTNVGMVRRLDTANLDNMFLPLLNEAADIRNTKELEAFGAAVGELRQIASSAPQLLYDNSAEVGLKITNYGFERMEDVARVFDKLAEFLPANPLMWFRPVREAFGRRNTVTTVDGIEDAAPRYSFRNLIGPGFSGLLAMQSEITRQVADIARTGVQSYIQRSFDIIKLQTQANQLELKSSKLMRQAFARNEDIVDILSNNQELQGTLKQLDKKYEAIDSLISKVPGHRYENKNILGGGTYAYSSFRKFMFSTGSLFIADYLLDQFVLRPQGAAITDSVMSDLFGSLSPEVAGREGDANYQAAYGVKYAGGAPGAVKYSLAGVAYLAGGYVFPKVSAHYTKLGLLLQKQADELSESSLATLRAVHGADDEALTLLQKATATVMQDAPQGGPLLRSFRNNRLSFGFTGAFIGGAFALLATQMFTSVAAATMQPLVQGIQAITGRRRDPHAGLELDPIKGTAAAILAKSYRQTYQRKIVDANEYGSAQVLQLLSGALQDSAVQPGRTFYPFATQIASPFFQFATVAKLDPVGNEITIDHGLQLFPLLGVGLMVPSVISPKIKYSPTVAERYMINNMVGLPEGISTRVGDSQQPEANRDAYETYRQQHGLVSLLFMGGLNPTFDYRPFMFIGGMTALSSMQPAFKQGVRTAMARSPVLKRELENYRTAYHLGRLGVSTLDRAVRGAYSLSVSGVNALIKGASAVTGWGARGLFKYGALTRTLAPFYLSASLVAGLLRPGMASSEVDLTSTNEILDSLRKDNVESSLALHRQSLLGHVASSLVGGAIFGATVASTGAFRAAYSFENAKADTYVGRKQQQLYGWYLEHLEKMGVSVKSAAAQRNLLSAYLEANTAKIDAALISFEATDLNGTQQELLALLKGQQAAKAAGRVVDESGVDKLLRLVESTQPKLIRNAPTRLAMASRRLAPLLLGSFIAAQFLATTDFYQNDPLSSLLKAVTNTGRGDFTYEQRQFMSSLGIQGMRYQPKNFGDAVGNIRDYVARGIFFMSTNPIGAYQDAPNAFLGVGGPVGISQQQATARTYLQSQSLAADVSGSFYVMPAMVSDLALSKELAPLITTAQRAINGGILSSATAYALAQASSIRYEAATVRGEISGSENSAVSSPELQLALSRRADLIEHLQWQNAGDILLGLVKEFGSAGRIGNGNVKGRRTTFDYVLQNFTFETLDIGGNPIKQTKRSNKEFAHLLRSLSYGSKVNNEISSTLYDYERVRDSGPSPIFGYLQGLMGYVLGNFYDPNTSQMSMDYKNLPSTLLLLGAATAMTASFVGTTLSSGLQLIGAVSAFQTYGTLSDVAGSLDKAQITLNNRLKSTYFTYDRSNQRLYLINNSKVGQLDIKLADKQPAALRGIFGSKGKVGKLGVFSGTLGDAATDLYQLAADDIGGISNRLNTLNDGYLVAIGFKPHTAGGQQVSVIEQVLGGSRQAPVLADQVFNNDDLISQITKILSDPKPPAIRQLQIQELLTRRLINQVDELAGTNRFTAVENPNELAVLERAATHTGGDAPHRSNPHQTLRFAITDPSSDYIQNVIQNQGYSGLFKGALGGVFRLTMAAADAKAAYEGLSFTTQALSQRGSVEQKRTAYAAGGNLLQSFGLLVPAQMLLSLGMKAPGLMAGIALVAGVAGGLALANPATRKFFGSVFKPTFKAIDTNILKPTIYALAGTLEAISAIPGVGVLAGLTRPLFNVSDAAFTSLRRQLKQGMATGLLADVFIPETTETFLERFSEQRPKMTAYGELEEFYTAAEYEQWRAASIKARRQRAGRLGSGISTELVSPFLQGRVNNTTLGSLLIQRLSGGNRVTSGFLTNSYISPTLHLAIRMRQSELDSYVGGMLYVRTAYEKDNPAPVMAYSNVAQTYSLATTMSLVQAPLRIGQRTAQLGVYVGSYLTQLVEYAAVRRTVYGSLTGVIAAAGLAQSLNLYGEDKTPNTWQATATVGVGLLAGGGVSYAAPYGWNAARRGLSTQVGLRRFAAAVSKKTNWVATKVINGVQIAKTAVAQFLNKPEFWKLAGISSVTGLFAAGTIYDASQMFRPKQEDERLLGGRFWLATGVGLGLTLGTTVARAALPEQTLFMVGRPVAKYTNALLSGSLKVAGGVGVALGAYRLTYNLLTNGVTGSLLRNLYKHGVMPLLGQNQREFEQQYNTFAQVAAGVITAGAAVLTRDSILKLNAALAEHNYHMIIKARELVVAKHAAITYAELMADVLTLGGRRLVNPIFNRALKPLYEHKVKPLAVGVWEFDGFGRFKFDSLGTRAKRLLAPASDEFINTELLSRYAFDLGLRQPRAPFDYGKVIKALPAIVDAAALGSAGWRAAITRPGTHTANEFRTTYEGLFRTIGTVLTGAALSLGGPKNTVGLVATLLGAAKVSEWAGRYGQLVGDEQYNRGALQGNNYNPLRTDAVVGGLAAVGASGYVTYAAYAAKEGSATLAKVAPGLLAASSVITMGARLYDLGMPGRQQFDYSNMDLRRPATTQADLLGDVLSYSALTVLSIKGLQGGRSIARNAAAGLLVGAAVVANVARDELIARTVRETDRRYRQAGIIDVYTRNIINQEVRQTAGAVGTRVGLTTLLASGIAALATRRVNPVTLITGAAAVTSLATALTTKVKYELAVEQYSKGLSWEQYAQREVWLQGLAKGETTPPQWSLTDQARRQARRLQALAGRKTTVTDFKEGMSFPVLDESIFPDDYLARRREYEKNKALAASGTGVTDAAAALLGGGYLAANYFQLKKVPTPRTTILPYLPVGATGGFATKLFQFASNAAIPLAGVFLANLSQDQGKKQNASLLAGVGILSTKESLTYSRVFSQMVANQAKGNEAYAAMMLPVSVGSGLSGIARTIGAGFAVNMVAQTLGKLQQKFYERSSINFIDDNKVDMTLQNEALDAFNVYTNQRFTVGKAVNAAFTAASLFIPSPFTASKWLGKIYNVRTGVAAGGTTGNAIDRAIAVRRSRNVLTGKSQRRDGYVGVGDDLLSLLAPAPLLEIGVNLAWIAGMHQFGKWAGRNTKAAVDAYRARQAALPKNPTALPELNVNPAPFPGEPIAPVEPSINSTAVDAAEVTKPPTMNLGDGFVDLSGKPRRITYGRGKVSERLLFRGGKSAIKQGIADGSLARSGGSLFVGVLAVVQGVTAYNILNAPADDFKKTYGYEAATQSALATMMAAALLVNKTKVAKAIPGLGYTIDATQLGFGVYRLNTATNEVQRQQSKEDIGGAVGSMVGSAVGSVIGGFLGGLATVGWGTGVGIVAGNLIGGVVGEQVGRQLVKTNQALSGAMNAFDLRWWTKRQAVNYSLSTIQTKDGKSADVAATSVTVQEKDKFKQVKKGWWRRFSEGYVNAHQKFLAGVKDIHEAVDGFMNGVASFFGGGGDVVAKNSRGLAIIDAARDLGINPVDLATIIMFESGGVANINNGVGFEGIIQFGAAERRMYGYKPGMSFEDQLRGPVRRYLKHRFEERGMTTQGADLATLYTTVLRGNPKADRNKRDAFGTSVNSALPKMLAPGGHRDRALEAYFDVVSGTSLSTGRVINGSGKVTERYRVTMPHGQNYEASRPGRLHSGQDFDISGNQQAQSFLGGKVTYVGIQTDKKGNPIGYGRMVHIYNQELGVVEFIAEMANTTVKVGDMVQPGGSVGYGESVTGVLHYEIRTKVDSRGVGVKGHQYTRDPIKYYESLGLVKFSGGELKVINGRPQLDVNNQTSRLAANRQTSSSPKAIRGALESIPISALMPLQQVMYKGEGGPESVNTKSGASNFIKTMGKSADQLTLGEIRKAQDAGIIRAVGYSQLIPDTLQKAMTALGLDKSTRFNKKTQDLLFKYLIFIKRDGLGQRLLGMPGATTKEAGQDIAREFASVQIAYPEAPYQQLVESGTTIKPGWNANAKRKLGQGLYNGVNGNVARTPQAAAQAAIEAAASNLRRSGINLVGVGGTLYNAGAVTEPSSFRSNDQRNNYQSSSFNTIGLKQQNPRVIPGGATFYQYQAANPSKLQAVGNNVTLEQQAARQFKAMVAEAKKAGLNIAPVSGYRSDQDQAKLWSNQVKKQGGSEAKASRISAPAGYSEHRTGQVIDISSASNNYGLTQNFANTVEYKWTLKNAGRFGYELSYPENNAQGVMNEPWHWRYGGVNKSNPVFYQQPSRRQNKVSLTPATPATINKADIHARVIKESDKAYSLALAANEALTAMIEVIKKNKAANQKTVVGIEIAAAVNTGVNVNNYPLVANAAVRSTQRQVRWEYDAADKTVYVSNPINSQAGHHAVAGGNASPSSLNSGAAVAPRVNAPNNA